MLLNLIRFFVNSTLSFENRSMNFLAHIYLSFGDDEITIGNFIADSIRGNKFKHLPERVQQGIKLHRNIDSFTDAHETWRKSKKRLYKNYGHYSGIIVESLKRNESQNQKQIKDEFCHFRFRRTLCKIRKRIQFLF